MTWCSLCGLYEVQAEWSNGMEVCAQCYVLHVHNNWERYDDEGHRRAVRLGIKEGLQQAIGEVDDMPKEPVVRHRLPKPAWSAFRKMLRKRLVDLVMTPPDPLR